MTTTKTSLIDNETIIQVHFNDLYVGVENKTFATYIDGKLIVLKDEGADSNDLEEIAELAGCKVEEAQETDEENLYLYYFKVKNGDLGAPFTDNDIPEHFFDLGILAK